MARQVWICRQEGDKTCFYEPSLVPIQGRIHVIGDLMDPLWNPADNKYYTSKSNMAKSAKAMGLECMGNEKFPERREKKDPSLKQMLIEQCKDIRS